jgi:hypothetical protein
VVSVIVPSCAEDIERVELSTSPLAKEPRLMWSAKIAGKSGALVPLTEAIGTFSPAEELQLEVFTPDQIFVANWPGSDSTAFPPDSGEVIVQGKAVNLNAFVAGKEACRSSER